MQLGVPFVFSCSVDELRTPLINSNKAYLDKLPELAETMPWLAYLNTTSSDTTAHASYEPAGHVVEVMYLFTVTEKQGTFYTLKYGSH